MQLYLQKCKSMGILKSLASNYLKAMQYSKEKDWKSMRNNVDTNEDNCFQCGKKGKLSCCHSCIRAYHINCSKFAKNTEAQWQCEVCHSIRPCQFCLKSSDQSQDIVFCTICQLGSHSQCIQEYHQAPQHLVNSTLLKRNSYVCKKCLFNYGIRTVKQTLRIIKSNGLAPQEKIVVLVQINYKSPVHFSIYRESDIIQLHQQKNKPKYINIYSQELYDNLQIYKLLQMKIPKNYQQQGIRVIKDTILSKQREQKLNFGTRGNFRFLVKWKHADYSQCTWQEQQIVAKLDPQQRHRKTFLSFQQQPIKQLSINLMSLFQQNDLTWDPSTTYENLIKIAKYHKIYPIQILQYNNLQTIIPTMCYFLAYTCLIEKSVKISLLLVRWENMQLWRNQLKELSSILEVVQFQGSQANVNAIKMKQLSNNSKPKLHVLLISFDTFQIQRKFFASKIQSFGLIILENHRNSIQIAQQFRARNTVLLTNQVSTNANKSQFSVQARNNFKGSFIFKSDINIHNVDVLPPFDFTINTLNPSCNRPQNIKYFKVHTIRQEKRCVILRFIIRFGIPTYNMRQFYSLLRDFEPQVFDIVELSEQNQAKFQGYITSLIILLAIHTQIYLTSMVQQYYFSTVDLTKLQNRVISMQKIRIFVKQGKELTLPPTQIHDTNGILIGNFTYWKSEDELMLCKLVLQYGLGTWDDILQSKSWSKHSKKSQNPLLNYRAYLKMKCYMQFKTNNADFKQFLQKRFETIVINL